MARLLLDTNALIWFISEAPLEDEALFEIATAQQDGTLFVSPISAWEAALALRKANPARRPDLGGNDAATWFRRARQASGARLATIGVRIALEAARVPDVYGIDDPGDCYIIATARTNDLIILTRDGPMTDLSEARPDYVRLIQC